VEISWELESVRGLLPPAIVRIGKLLSVLKEQREMIAVASEKKKRGAVMA
jgi:hypothetical protein